MDTNLIVACMSLAAFVGGIIGYVVREVEGFDPRPADVHSEPDDVETRARRAQ